MGVIEAIKAGLIDIAALQAASNRDRLETAFDVAESQLGIARLLGKSNNSEDLSWEVSKREPSSMVRIT